MLLILLCTEVDESRQIDEESELNCSTEMKRMKLKKLDIISPRLSRPLNTSNLPSYITFKQAYVEERSMVMIEVKPRAGRVYVTKTDLQLPKLGMDDDDDRQGNGLHAPLRRICLV